MLTRVTLESARELAEELERRRVHVEPLVDTPLEAMVKASEPVVDLDKSKDKWDTVEILDSLEDVTVTPIDLGPTSHDSVVEPINDELVELINRRLYTAKEVINPLINLYTTWIENEVRNNAPELPSIKVVEFGDFYKHPLVKDVFTGYGVKDANEKIYGLSGIQFNDENNYYLDGLKTGSSFIDKKLNEIIEKRGQDWYIDTVNSYFNKGEELVVNKPEATEEFEEFLDKNLVAHMLARHFVNKGERLVGDDQNKWDLDLVKLLGRTAQNVKSAFDLQDKLDENGVVISTPSTEGSVIQVYGPNYRSYILKGGSDTALMGAVQSRKTFLSYESLAEQTEQLEKVYDDKMSSQVQSLRSESLTLIKLAASRLLPGIINEIPEYILNTIPEIKEQGENPDVYSVLVVRGKEFISNAVVNVDNIYQYASDIILKGLLPELELDRFFTVMENYLKPQPGVPQLSPKQAAYYAVLEELVKYFLSQTSLSEISK